MNYKLAELEYARSLSTLSLLKLEHKRARALVDIRTIRSPIDGVVIEKYLSAGEAINERALFKIAQLNPLKVEAILPGELYGLIQPGMIAEVTSAMEPFDKYTAEVKIVSPVIDTASGTFDVMLALPNSENLIPAGLRCKLEFNDHTVVKNNPLKLHY